MRTLYFLRHAEPAFPEGTSICLGRLDLPLSILGRLQAAVAGHELDNLSITAVFCSPLQRARQTAALLRRPFHVLDGLQEIDTGEWDGLAFEEIRRRWPLLYERRGKEPFLTLPQAEPQGLSLLRFLHAIGTAAQKVPGNLLFVTHSGILRAFFAVLGNLPPLDGLSSLTRAGTERLLQPPFDRANMKKPPYGSISSVIETNGGLKIQELGRVPHPIPDRDFCLDLLETAQTPSRVVRHTMAVAKEADRLLSALEDAGTFLAREPTLSAALLHDIARTEKAHAKQGAEYLDRLGYPDIAALIRTHHDMPPDKKLDEAALVFLADKLVQEDRPVSLKKRFEGSARKCVTQKQKEKHQERYRAALHLATEVNKICGYEAAII